MVFLEIGEIGKKAIMLNHGSHRDKESPEEVKSGCHVESE
jgi:hypothetical protein